MDEITKNIIAGSINNRLALSGHTDKDQAQVWTEAVLAILTDTTDDAVARAPKKGQANFRKMISLCRKFYDIEIQAYKKYLSDRKKGLDPDDAAARMKTRLEHQRQPIDFSI